MEGPFDKVVTFLTVGRTGDEVKIPLAPGMPEALATLGGRTLGGLLKIEYEATSAALARAGRMSCTLALPELSPAVVGELLMFFQLATGYAGCWYGVNPFDQPGVELAKRLMFAALGRPGYDTPPEQPEDGTDTA